MRGVRPVPAESSLRLWPSDWLHPMDLEGVWEQAGPRVLDLGCGKGRFLLEHARRHPEYRLLGIERKLRRVNKIDRKAVREGLRNLRLLRMEAHYAMRYLMPAAWLDVCFVYFPDPWPKAKHQGHRLFSPDFLDTLDRTLAPGGVVHFATDHAPYFLEVRELVEGDRRWKAAPVYLPDEGEVSDFELVWRDQKPIGRLSFQRA